MIITIHSLACGRPMWEILIDLNLPIKISKEKQTKVNGFVYFWEGVTQILKLFFDGMCIPRSETQTNILGFLSCKKMANLTTFSKFLKNGTHIYGGFHLKNDWFVFIYFFFQFFVKWDKKWQKWDPCVKIFWWKTNPFRWHIPVYLNMIYGYPVSTFLYMRLWLSCAWK